MQVQQFLDLIEANNDRPLLFDYGNGKIVQGGYHVTEIKNATFNTIDCGNSLHRWKEVRQNSVQSAAGPRPPKARPPKVSSSCGSCFEEFAA